MSDRLHLRRRLYEELRRAPRRSRRVLRRQISVLSAHLDGPDDGSAGVREPRRTPPGSGPASLP